MTNPKKLAEMSPEERTVQFERTCISEEWRQEDADVATDLLGQYQQADDAAGYERGKREGALITLQKRRASIAHLYLDDEDPEHDDTGRKVVLMILSDLDASILRLEKEAPHD